MRVTRCWDGKPAGVLVIIVLCACESVAGEVGLSSRAYGRHESDSSGAISELQSRQSQSQVDRQLASGGLSNT